MTEQPANPSETPVPGLHGSAPPRGIENVPRSPIETGRFGRLFRGLTPLALDADQIGAIVATMFDGAETPGTGWNGTPSPADGALAAGWTYFAQFVDHDLTFDPTSLLDQANDPDALENFRTPRFDLDSLYGLGPQASPWLYDDTDPDKLLLGTAAGDTRDLPRNWQGRALIGDPRNDVHVIISQLHLAFARFHNNVVDRVKNQPDLVTGVPATPVGGWGGGSPAAGVPTFGQIVTLVRWHYQWIVLTEFMPLIVGEAIASHVLPRHTKKDEFDPDLKLYSVNRKPWMPVEFSAAAYRFGHTLVRDAYQLNAGLGHLPVFSQAGDTDHLADLRGFRPLPSGWDIEWHRFFDGLPGSGPETQRARLFDTKLVPSLHRLPGKVDAMQRSLAELNLRRGVALQLPSGEEVAVVVEGKLHLDPPTTPVTGGFSHPTPLWFWFLKEAEATGGQSLGPVGGRVVAEVLVGLAQNDRSSFLRKQPSWKPNLVPEKGDFSIADLLTIAGVTL